MAVEYVNDYPLSERESPTVSPRMSSLLDDLKNYLFHNDLQNFQQCLRLGMNDYNVDISCVSPIMNEAIKLKRASFVETLLACGLPIWPSDSVEAVRAQATNVLEIFLNHGWDINRPIGPEVPAVLSFAVRDLEMTRWLLEHGADPNQRCDIDQTPLSIAISVAPLSIINLLFDHGGDVTMGQLLHNAMTRDSDSLEVVKLLINRGADVNAVMYQNHQASLQRRFYMAETPLHSAIYYDKPDVICYLLNSGADARIQNAKGQTAIEYATESKSIEVRKSIQQSH